MNRIHARMDAARPVKGEPMTERRINPMADKQRLDHQDAIKFRAALEAIASGFVSDPPVYAAFVIAEDAQRLEPND